MVEIEWKLDQITSEDEFHDLVEGSLSFPSYYGRNLDAFWDSLNEIVEQVTVRVSGREAIAEDLRSRIDDYIGMCKEYEQATGGSFRVLAD